MNEGLRGKLTLVSAQAGFGKTTLVAEWAAGCGRPVAWLSLDEGDNDPVRFLHYLVAALRTVATNIGEGVFSMLRSPQMPPTESIVSALINDISAVRSSFVLVLDDYHSIDAGPVDHAITLLIERMPPQVHLIITARQDPALPLARLRVRDQLSEIRSDDLRFTADEAAQFLNESMSLQLSDTEVSLLETRTEGWIAGLQLAALSLRNHANAAAYLHSFAGNHPYVLDYLIEEVLQQQPDHVQTFLLRTSVLERLSGPLCDTIIGREETCGQRTLEQLERMNLFLIPLDSERQWYRYHHLFAEALRQRLKRDSSSGEEAEVHLRASEWYEENGFELDAFRHAAAAEDVARAARLLEGNGVPLLFRGSVGPVLKWLATLPAATLNATPSLWVTYASALLFAAGPTDVEPKLQAAEAILQSRDPDEEIRDLIGHISTIRATIAVSRHQADEIVAQSLRALDYLRPNNLPIRTATTWSLGYAYQLRGERAAAGEAYTEAIAISRAIGHYIIHIMALIGLGNVQEDDNQLSLAEETYRGVLRLAGEPPIPVACEALLGLARISYERNDHDAAEEQARHALRLARLIENTDRFVACQLFQARMMLARGDLSGAQATIVEAGHTARLHRFVLQLPSIAAVQAETLLRQGKEDEARAAVGSYELPLSQARVSLALGDASAALAALEPFIDQAEAKGWANERLKATILRSLAFQASGDKKSALRQLGEALAMAEPGGFVRSFVDEGMPMAKLLLEAADRGQSPDYVAKLLTAFEAENGGKPGVLWETIRPFVEPLSERELEVLRLIAQGLSNEEISKRLYLALSSVKGHNQNIFGKLQVRRRTEAVARARELGLLQ
ncbi:LuxR C-terminal-related transcriptional regulator [Cohnella boryungensis]|uniref:LuxR C-terminal-related transcriptional regulator n=1 Tax=Cohnella boryungensis TaxID=768479 RepID=A0ABV8S4N2_9BACL